MVNLWLLAAIVALASAQNALDIASDTASIAFGVNRDVILSRVGPGKLKLDGTLHVTGDLKAGSSPAAEVFASRLAQMSELAGWDRLVTDPYLISCSGGLGGGNVELLSDGCNCECALSPDPTKTWDVSVGGAVVPYELPNPGFEHEASLTLSYPRTDVRVARIRTNGARAVGMMRFPVEDSTDIPFLLEPTTDWQIVRFYTDYMNDRLSSARLEIGFATAEATPLVISDIVFYTDSFL